MTHEEFNEIAFDFYRTITVAAEKLYAPVLRQHHLSIVQLRLLMTVRMNKDVTIGHLSDLTGINSGNCSSMCKRMETAGLLSRRRDPVDERIVRVSLSEAGNEITCCLLRQSALFQDKLQAEAAPEEARILAESARIIRKYIDKLT